MPVAPSYQKFAIEGEPFTTNNRLYVRLSNGRIVRWYTEAQYEKLYPSVKTSEKTAATEIRSRKQVLGFSLGFITIFKGDTYAHLDWFRESPARYNKLWGWFFTSDDALPEDLPPALTPIQLTWEQVSINENLRPDSEIENIVQSMVNDPSPSEFQGSIGARLELTLKVVKAVPVETNYGLSTIHTMEDKDGNVYVWSTAAKKLSVDTEYKMRGTVKDHLVYRNTKQTILTRCALL